MSPKAIPEKANLPDFPFSLFALALIVLMFRRKLRDSSYLGVVFAQGCEFLLVFLGERFGVAFRWVAEGGFPVEAEGKGEGGGEGGGWGGDRQTNRQVNAHEESWKEWLYEGWVWVQPTSIFLPSSLNLPLFGGR